MRRRLIVAFALSGALLAGLPVLGAEGRTPVFLPGTVLGADGKYIVTRNLVAAAGPVISICALDVELDLNGFLVANGGGGPAIAVGTGGCLADHAVIRNGIVSGGAPVIEVGAIRKVDIEDLKIHDSAGDGIMLTNTLTAALRRNEIVDGAGVAINWVGPAGPKVATIENNIIRRHSGGIQIRNNCSSVAILTNRIDEIFFAAPGAGDAIVLDNCDAALVSENTIQLAARRGIDVIGCAGSKLFDNVIFGAGSLGIHLDPASMDNLVLNNVVSSSGLGGAFGPGDALLVEGARNLIERNVLNNGSGFGLRFCGPVACANTFGRNMARGNAGGFNPFCAPAACNAAAGTMGPVLFPPNSCNQPIGCPAAIGPNSTFGDNLIPGPPIF